MESYNKNSKLQPKEDNLLSRITTVFDSNVQFSVTTEKNRKSCKQTASVDHSKKKQIPTVPKNIKKDLMENILDKDSKITVKDAQRTKGRGGKI